MDKESPFSPKNWPIYLNDPNMSSIPSTTYGWICNQVLLRPQNEMWGANLWTGEDHQKLAYINYCVR
jgi:NADH:ubiquinone oxidoreductase subunit